MSPVPAPQTDPPDDPRPPAKSAARPLAKSPGQAPGQAGAQAGAQRTVYRQPAWLRLVSSLPMFVASGMLLTGGIQDGGSTLWFGAVAAVLLLGVAARAWWLMIAVGADVTIVNWRRTRHYPWSDVEAFVYNRAGLSLIRRNAEIVKVAAFALGRGIPAIRRKGEALAEELEAVRKARRGPGPARGGKKKRRK